MKKVMILLGAAMLCACGGGGLKEKTYSHEENVEYLCDLAHDSPGHLKYWLSDGQIDTIADGFRKLNMKMSPYTSMQAIKHELDEVWHLCYDNVYEGVLYGIALSRTEFHLHNPITWREYKPTEEYNPLGVCATPDGKYKFYTTRDLCTGSAGDFMTYYQFEEDGKIMCKLFEGRYDDWRHSNVCDVWQFDYHDSTFYVLQGKDKEAGCVWSYTMDIVTFERDGALKYHNHFIPYDEFEYEIAWTYSCLPAGYTFDPETLTVTAQTQEGDSLATKTWKLKLD